MLLAQYNRRRSVVLIDEIDKADLDFPNDLLLELDRLRFQVTEIPGRSYAVPEPTDTEDLRPIIFVTHNEEKALPTAFLRRCVFYYVEFPKDERELVEILAAHEMTNAAITTVAAKQVQQLRTREYAKPPGLSELLDWVGYLHATEQQTPGAMTPERLQTLPYLEFLLKHRSDQDRAVEKFRPKT